MWVLASETTDYRYVLYARTNRSTYKSTLFGGQKTSKI